METLFEEKDFAGVAAKEPAKRTKGMGIRRDFNDYEAFVDKFKTKKTSDDCYTPPLVYEAVKRWVDENMMSLEGVEICRPFCPGGDYENYDYPEGCLVLDNPPFSILSQIKRFYHERGIKYFLFAPSLTLCSSGAQDETYVVSGYDIEYANGAKISTSYVTNIESEARLIVSGTLSDMIKAAEKQAKAEKDEWRPSVYVYPETVTSAALLQKISCRGGGVDLRIGKDECQFIRRMDSQAAKGKTIFGNGWLLSESAAAAAARANAIEWELSDREKEIIKRLGAPKT